MRAGVFLQGLIGFLIVAFGVPSFAPILGPIAAFVGYALFWRAIRIYPFRTQRFWRGFLWYGAVALIQLSWMNSIEYQGIYILFVWFGLSIWLGAQFGFLSLLIPYNKPLKVPRILAIASAWTLLEWSRYFFICGFSWNPSGLAFCNTSAIQFAALFGVLGLSFWVILTNLVGLRAFLKRGIPNYMIWFAVALFPYFFGTGYIKYHDGKKEEKTLSCLLVQTGLLPPEKVPLLGRVDVFVPPVGQWERIIASVKEHQDEKIDLIVLPEAAVMHAKYSRNDLEKIFTKYFGSSLQEHFPKTQNITNLSFAQTLSNVTGSEVVVGLDHVDAERNAYNSAFHLIPKKNDVTRYDKQILMPLAEYLPIKFLSSLVSYYGISDFFTHGKDATIFYGKVPLTANICYEETFPQIVRKGRLNGGELMVNLTNDGWYPNSRLPSQHYEHAKFRSIENGASLVRACNTGVTAAIDPLGRAISKMDQHDENRNLQSGAIFAKVPTGTIFTPFLVWGNYGIVCLSALILGVFLCLKKEYYL